MVGVVDERSEIGGCYMGIVQNNLGMRTDVLDCCPKAEGMIMLIRSMSPRGDIERISMIIPSAFGQQSRTSVRIPRLFCTIPI